MSLPNDRRYTKDHEWVKVEGDSAVIGITEFAQSELGELVFVDLPAVGKAITQGATLCVVESTKAASDVYAPLSGTVKEVNSPLGDSPATVNTDPYGSGWLVRIENFNNEEIGSLMSAEQYEQHLTGK